MGTVSQLFDQQLAALAAQQEQLGDTASQLADLASSTEAQTARTISDTIAIELGTGEPAHVYAALQRAAWGHVDFQRRNCNCLHGQQGKGFVLVREGHDSYPPHVPHAHAQESGSTPGPTAAG